MWKIFQVVMNARLRGSIIEVDGADPGVPDVPLAVGYIP